MLIPYITLIDKFKTGWIGDDLSEPQIKVTYMPEDYNWYHEHGLPDPSNAQDMLDHRIKKEAQRKAKREEDFWNEIGKKIKFDTIIAQSDGPYWWDDADVTPQCITNPYDIKLNFR